MTAVEFALAVVGRPGFERTGYVGLEAEGELPPGTIVFADSAEDEVWIPLEEVFPPGLGVHVENCGLDPGDFHFQTMLRWRRRLEDQASNQTMLLAVAPAHGVVDLWEESKAEWNSQAYATRLAGLVGQARCQNH